MYTFSWKLVVEFYEIFGKFVQKRFTYLWTND